MKKKIIGWSLALVVLAPFLIYFLGQINPFYSAFIVTSGSMEPKIDTGSIVYVENTKNVSNNDIITFNQDGTTVTHRIIEEREDGYVTKGDANEDPDNWRVQKRDIVGEVALSVPWVGKAVNWAGTASGTIFFILIPAGLVIAYEIKNIWTEIYSKSSKKTEEYFPAIAVVTAVSLVILVIAGGSMILNRAAKISYLEIGLLAVLILSLGIIWLELKDIL